MLTDAERIALVVLALDHEGLVTPDEARQLLRDGLADGQSFASWLGARTKHDDVLAAIAAELGIDFVDFGAVRNPYSVDAEAVARLDLEVLKRHVAIPLRDRRDDTIVMGTANPLDVALSDYVRAKMPGTRVALIPVREVNRKLVFLEAEGMDAQAIDDDEREEGATGVVAQSAQSSPAVEWIDTTLDRAALEGASDVHFTWDVRKRLRLKLRVDGHLREFPVPLNRSGQREAIGALIAKCPNVDSTNLREPIDATFSFATSGNRRIDVRLAMLPQINGPTVVLRLLDPESVQGSLESKGLADGHISVLREAMGRSQGMVIVTGPTGSGKSTTLYTLLNEVDSASRNVHTVEDPVEYRINGINQTPIRSDIGERSITFARALRSILRLDPDVILVGEMRDVETAKTGLDAAITGHLVLSTLHANDAVQTFSRLIEMNVPPYLVAEAITASVSQRLCRTLHECAAERPVTSEERELLARHGQPGVDTVREPVGCDGCAQTGFKGRAAVMEVLVPTRKLREAVASKASVGELYNTAFETGFRPMMTDGMRLVAEGRTTVAEIQLTLVEAEAS